MDDVRAHQQPVMRFPVFPTFPACHLVLKFELFSTCNCKPQQLTAACHTMQMNYQNKEMLMGAMIVAGYDDQKGGQVSIAACEPDSSNTASCRFWQVECIPLL